MIKGALEILRNLLITTTAVVALSLGIALFKGDVSLWFGLFSGISLWLILGFAMCIVAVIGNLAFQGSLLLIKLGLNKATGGRIAYLARYEDSVRSAWRRNKERRRNKELADR